jgi:FAD/FMN-containing dehydrogenase
MQVKTNDRVGGLLPTAVPVLNRLAARAPAERTYSDIAHRVFTTPRRVVFNETEYAVPRPAGVAALRELRRVVEVSGWRIGFPVEVRVVPADDVPLSPAYQRDSVYIACHTPVRADHVPYFEAVARVMRDHGGRPHWGKVHGLAADELAPLYPRFDGFRALRDRLDPDRVLGNAHLRQVLGD